MEWAKAVPRNFLDFMQGQQVQSLAQKMGYISVNALKALALKS
jgi:hypothetical protein